MPLHDVTFEEAMASVAALVERGRATGRTHQVVTVNVDFVVNAERDPALRSLLQRADLALADGMPLVWGSRMAGHPLRERVAGSDLVPALAGLCDDAGYGLYLFGGGPGVAARVAGDLAAARPGLRVRGESGPFFHAPEDMDPAALDDMRAFAPDVVCVALGHPKQERWIERYRQLVGAPVMIGVGASLDFLAGTQRRAPSWMQRSGLEWLHRAAQDPRRLGRRYARDLWRFGPRLVREVRAQRTDRAPGHAAGSSVVHRVGDTTVIRPRGPLRLDPATLDWPDDGSDAAVGRVVIDVHGRRSLDSGEANVVAALAKHVTAAGGEVALAGVSEQVMRRVLQLGLFGLVSVTSRPVSSVLDPGRTQPPPPPALRTA